MKILIPILFLLISAFTGCFYDSEEYLYPKFSDCDTSNVTYSVCINTILDETCRSCHGGSASSGGGIKLNSYDDVKKQVDNNKLLGSIKWTSGYRPMPEGSSKLESSKIEIIEKWISKSAPNN